MVSPSEFLVRPLAESHVAVNSASSRGIHLPFRVSNACHVSRLLLRETTSPLAISSTLWLSAPDTGKSRVNDSCPLLSSASAFLQSFPRSNLAERRRLRDTPGSSPGLPFPSALASRKGPLSASLAKPARFRLQGLATLLTACSLRGLDGPVSSRQRSWDFSLRSIPLPQGGRHVSATAEPACRQPRAISYRRTCRPERKAPTSGL